MELSTIFEWIASFLMIFLMGYVVYKYTKQNHDFKF